MSILEQDVRSTMQSCKEIGLVPYSAIGTVRGKSRAQVIFALAKVFEATEGLSPKAWTATLDMRNEQDQNNQNEGAPHAQDHGLSEDVRDNWFRATQYASVLNWLDNQKFDGSDVPMFPAHRDDNGLYGSVLYQIEQSTNDLSEADIEQIEPENHADGAEAREQFETCERLTRFIKDISERGQRLIEEATDLQEPEDMPQIWASAVGNEEGKLNSKRIKGWITADQRKQLKELFKTDKVLAQAY